MLVSFWTNGNLISFSDFDASVNIIKKMLLDYIFELKGNYNITLYALFRVYSSLEIWFLFLASIFIVLHLEKLFFSLLKCVCPLFFVF